MSIRFGAKGPNLATCTACSASAHAIGESFEIIRRGDADAMIAGGSEAAITPMSVGGFGAHARAVDAQRRARRAPAGRSTRIATASSSARAPACSSSRSSSTRGGAARRSTPSSSATACRADAYHITAPSEDGDGGRPRHGDGPAARPASRPDQVDYINAHGTSTPYNDRLETLAIKRCFGEHARKAGDLVDQVDDRPPARRRRRPRGRHLGAGRAPPGRAADDQPRPPRPRVRSRLRAAHEPRRCRSGTRCRTPSASAAPTPRCCSRDTRRDHARDHGDSTRHRATACDGCS